MREGGTDPTTWPTPSEVERDGPGAVPVIPVHAHHQPNATPFSFPPKLNVTVAPRIVKPSTTRARRVPADHQERRDDEETEVKTVVDQPGPDGTPDETTGPLVSLEKCRGKGSRKRSLAPEIE